jgi:hypothetical protein
MNMTIITVIGNQLFGFKGNNDSNDSNNSNSTKSVFRATMRVAISSFWVHDSCNSQSLVIITNP